jgi:hypothetical protein
MKSDGVVHLGFLLRLLDLMPRPAMSRRGID